MARADHIYVRRLGYQHHGIEAGDGTVLHYTGEVGRKSNAAVRRTPIGEFSKGTSIHAKTYGRSDPPDVVMERATSRLSEAQYNLFSNNCEHFATWCKTGQVKSEQVKDVAAVTGGTGVSGAAVAAGLGTVSATGAVAGLSASGIMSGLATIGSIVGGSAVSGIAVVSAGPAAVATGAMMVVLKDDSILHDAERGARRAGRIATFVGAVGGSVASVGAVAATGTAGLSAAGITSGLATVGATVGGGMAAGVAVTAAAPAVVAAAVGYGSYRVWKRLRRKSAGGE
jgi:hypothetical protein